jgi:hypothetical protein
MALETAMAEPPELWFQIAGLCPSRYGYRDSTTAR